MKLAWSSLAAFLAHHASLRAAPGRSEADRALLVAMDEALAALSAAERDALDAPPGATSGVARIRERAMRRLQRELIARGMLSG
jgi:hypothetical protein